MSAGVRMTANIVHYRRFVDVQKLLGWNLSSVLFRSILQQVAGDFGVFVGDCLCMVQDIL